jgi:hypothetical protein
MYNHVYGVTLSRLCSLYPGGACLAAIVIVGFFANGAVRPFASFACIPCVAVTVSAFHVRSAVFNLLEGVKDFWVDVSAEVGLDVAKFLVV